MLGFIGKICLTLLRVLGIFISLISPINSFLMILDWAPLPGSLFLFCYRLLSVRQTYDSRPTFSPPKPYESRQTFAPRCAPSSLRIERTVKVRPSRWPRLAAAW